MTSHNTPIAMARHGLQQQQQQQQHHSQYPVHGQHHNHMQPQMPMPVPIHAPAVPIGTFQPGTKIQVGEHRVVIQKYLSEGGFAHVYLVKLPRPIDGTDLAVLKRVAVPDKETLANMRTEVETMKRLKGHRPIVTYMDSNASELKGGGYEVFLLMEYCNGGGLIDFMNTRLQHRLTEPEILDIFADIAEGVACMHYLKPPLLHRDLKVENVLITLHGNKRKFKLCDFGSAAPPRPAPQTVAECRLIDEDVQRHTTMQYRSPEMVDVYRRQPIDEKSDIWALGVLLYKLCYYTTPFEEQGQLAILNASYRFPPLPVFSDRLKQLIASMLQEMPASRPNIYQVVRESCLMRGREVPIHDIYTNRPQSETQKGDRDYPPAERKTGATPTVGAVYSPSPRQQAQVIPTIAPMRRGRPTTAHQAPPVHPAAKVTAGDPFAALDSKPGAALEADELSSRFPTLDQFSILHDQGASFDFDSPTSPQASNGHVKPLGQQLTTEQLAENAFVKPLSAPVTALESHKNTGNVSRAQSAAGAKELIQPSPPLRPVQKTTSAPPKPVIEQSKASAIISNHPELQAISAAPSQPKPETQSRPVMVSTGTMTSPPLEAARPDYPPIHRFPPADHQRAPSLPRRPETANPRQSQLDLSQAPRPSPSPRVPSFHSQSVLTAHPSSSRPSLESGRPSMEYLEPLHRASSSSSRSRPASMYLESSMEYLREREGTTKPSWATGYSSPKISASAVSPRIEPQDEIAIQSNVEFLRTMEESDHRKKDKGAKHHSKRSSLTSLSGTKNILAGKFGDAFKRFEGNTATSSARTPSPLKEAVRHGLTPIAGSEATDDRSDDGYFLGESELTPEMRRELEARSLAEEERRVEAAAAEYKQRMAARDSGESLPLPRSIGGVSRAVSIQNRVQNLLEETQKSSQQVQRSASGYGKFSDEATARSRVEKDLPELPRKTIGSQGHGLPQKPNSSSSETLARIRSNGQDASSTSRPLIPAGRPSPAPKPTHLNNIPTGGRPRSPPKQQLPLGPASQTSAAERLVGVGVPGRPVLDMTWQEKEDYVQDFSKRFPSLSAIEMVERDIDVEVEKKGGR
ncbi:kinase-like protein [Xylariaceae sp. FL0594]|nr:kinase-like protein [Xylariaceae sp. FL0594]